MLKDINKRRPDRQLERNLVFLAYAIMFMSLSLFAIFVYPQYIFYVICSAAVFNIFCILITIRILKISENAIGFGALAGEILNDKSKYYRVDNAKGEAILINKVANEYFKGEAVLEFLEKNIINTPDNKMDLQKLSAAVNKLQTTTVTLSINPEQNSVFVAEEWLKVSVRPISLNKADIFEDSYSLQKVRKEIYLFWTVENITAYKNMDNVFKNEMSSLHNFLDYLPVGLYTCNNKGEIEYINNLLAEKLQTDKNDAIGRNIDDFIAHKPEQLHSDTGTYNDNIIFKTADGPQSALVRQENIRENDELKTRGVVIWNLPTNETLQAKVNKLTDYFSNLFDTAPIGIIFADKKQRIIEINNYVANIFEKKRDDILGQNINNFFVSEIKDKLKEAYIKYQTEEQSNFNFETVIKFAETEKNISGAIYPLKLYNTAYGNGISGIIIYLTDVTNRHSLEMQVAQAQKMQAFGQLAGGVAHDFNNLLTAVIGYCDLLLHRHGIGDPSFSDLVQLKNNVTRAVGVARQLLTISRKQPINPKLIDVNEAFTDNEHLIARMLGEKIKLQVNYGSELSYIRVDTVQLSQVLLNLAINAKDAMNGTGTFTMSYRTERLSIPYQFGADTIEPGDFAVISISDTGCGIPPENIERIFEPFFSTKKNVVGSGTGLGLAMVYSIVRQMDGFIKVHSELGIGTTFEIYLPLFDNSEETRKKQLKQDENIILDKSGKTALQTIPLSGEEQKIILGLNISQFDSERNLPDNVGEIKILFVEDEYDVRTVGARGLRRKGYDVVECVSAENALEHIESGEHFDMLITDMMMPGMNGAELAAIVHQKSPNTAIILASGYSEEIARKELAGSKDFYFIAKPYGLADLHNKVKEVLANNDKH